MTSNGTLTPPAQRASHGDVRDELEILIRARYPVIYVVSWEEQRVERQLREFATTRGKQLYCWTITTGLCKAGSISTGAKGRGPFDPVEGLDTVIEHKEPAIYVFKDLHPFLRPQNPGNTATIRKLREVAQALSDSYKSLIIISPLLEFAPELQKDVTVIDYPLPTRTEVDGLLSRIIDDVREHADIGIELDEKSREALIQAAGGLTLQETENVFAKTLVNDGRLSGNDISTVFAEKRQIIRKSGLLEYYDSAAEIEDVGGLEVLKDWLRRRSLAFSEKARQFGLPAPKGVLLVGVQGCGKSLCAKAVSRMWNMPLLRFDMGRMFASLVGSSEENIRRAISVAESIAPVVLWVDEIDKAFAGSSGSGNTDGGTTARVMSTFLTWLSEKRSSVFVLATANNIAHLPPELLRKGRLDEIFFVDLPNQAERERILEIHLRRREREPANFELAQLSAATDGFSGAEIEEAIISSLYDVFYLEKPLETEDVLRSVAQTVPLSRTMAEGITALRGWAEGRARWASSREEDATRHVRRKLEM